MTKTYTLTESTRAKKPRSKKLQGLVAEAANEQVEGTGNFTDTGYNDLETTGEGNAVTSVEPEGRKLNVKKETTFITKAQFDEIFEVVTKSGGTKYLRIKMLVQGDSNIIAFGG